MIKNLKAIFKNSILSFFTEDIQESDLYLQQAKNKFIETFIGGEENE